MKRIGIKKIMKAIAVFGIQVVAWTIFIVLAPLIMYIMSEDTSYAGALLQMLERTLIPCMCVYFLNYYLLIPYLLFKSRVRKVWFFVINLIAISGAPVKMIYDMELLHQYVPHSEWIQLGITAAIVMIVVLEIGAAGLAVALRNYLHTQKMKLQLNEEKRQHSEAELVWLKNQLNPHFLFNSLNNISSLVYLDSDKAQDAISNLSDLLRYAIYESAKKEVPLEKEVEFMDNYIRLMSLRCSDSTRISYDFDFENGSLPIVPLLLISLIENAFKHGVSTSMPSFIVFRLKEKDGVLTFVSENSNHPKTDEDRSGQGIGLANTRRRLELAYGDRYSWNQVSDMENYKVEVIIDLTEK